MEKLQHLRMKKANDGPPEFNRFELISIFEPEKQWYAIYGEDIDEYYWVRIRHVIPFLGLAKWSVVYPGPEPFIEPCGTTLVGVDRIDGIWDVCESSNSCFGVCPKGHKISNVNDWHCPIYFPYNREVVDDEPKRRFIK